MEYLVAVYLKKLKVEKVFKDFLNVGKIQFDLKIGDDLNFRFAFNETRLGIEGLRKKIKFLD
jgi:hypothetical protein